jgi:hypothetical protein
LFAKQHIPDGTAMKQPTLSKRPVTPTWSEDGLARIYGLRVADLTEKLVTMAHRGTRRTDGFLVVQRAAPANGSATSKLPWTVAEKTPEGERVIAMFERKQDARAFASSRRGRAA